MDPRLAVDFTESVSEPDQADHQPTSSTQQRWHNDDQDADIATLETESSDPSQAERRESDELPSVCIPTTLLQFMAA